MSVSLQDQRRHLARTKIRRYRQIVTGVQAAPPLGSYVGVAAGDLTTNSDERRAIVSSDLASRSIADGDDVRSDFYDGYYAYVLTAAPDQRRIALDGWTQSVDAEGVTDQSGNTEQVGYLICERNYGSVVPAGTTVELHSYPPRDADGMPGLHTFIYQALHAMRGMTRRLSLTGISGQQSYDLSAYGVTRQWQLGQVLGIGVSGMEPYSAPGAANLRTDGEKTYLVFTSGAPVVGPFYADVWLPRSAWILSKRAAVAAVTVTAGAVTAVTLLDGGAGYIVAPTVVFSGVGTGASVTATISNGAVTGFTGLVGGSGYVQASTRATIANPTSTTFALSTTGPVNELDEHTGDINEVSLVAYYHYCLARAEGPNGIDAGWMTLAEKAAKVARPFMEFGGDETLDAWSGSRLIEQGGAGSDWNINPYGRGY